MGIFRTSVISFIALGSSSGALFAFSSSHVPPSAHFEAGQVVQVENADGAKSGTEMGIAADIETDAETDVDSKDEAAPASGRTDSVFVPMREGGDQAFLERLYKDLASASDEDAANQITNNIFKVWSRSGSDTVDLLALRARKAQELENDETAEMLLTAIVEIAPNYAEGWNRRATYYFKKDDYARAVADVQRVLALDPRHFGALSGLGSILEQSGQLSSALEVYRKALEVNPFMSGPRKSVDKLEIEVEGREI